MAGDRYSLGDVATIDNLDTLSLERRVLDERRALEIGDIVSEAILATHALLARGLLVSEILSIIAEELGFGSYPSGDEVLAELSGTVSFGHSGLRSFDKVAFSELYLDRLTKEGIVVSEEDFLPSGDVPDSFIYVRNQLSEEAYDVLSQDFHRPTVAYGHSFKECADAVASGEAGYMLLPLEERGGTRIGSVAALIHRHDFKINAVTSVFGYLGDADVKYALVSKHFTIPTLKDGDEKYIELRVSDVGSDSFAELVSVATHFGLSINRVNTVTPSLDGESGCFSLVLRSLTGSLVGLLTYLTLFLPDAVPVGVYKNLE